MKVLLTGALGRLGSVVSQHLLDAGFEVRATDTRVDCQAPIKVLPVNLLDIIACYPLVEGVDAIVHLANHPSYHGRDAQRLCNENVSMNMNVFQAAAEAGVKRIVFASTIQTMTGTRRLGQESQRSCHAYLPADGNTTPTPGNPYALSKVLSERMLQYFHDIHGMNSVSFRFPHVVPREHMEYVQRSTEPHSGERLDELFTFLPVDDAGRVIVAALRAQVTGARVYFPVAARPRVHWPIPRLIETFYPGVPLRQPVEQMTHLVDLSGLDRDLGWKPEPV